VGVERMQEAADVLRTVSRLSCSVSWICDVDA
jgi:hypothetical protein